MRVGLIGLGKMGQAMAARLLAAGHDPTVYNRTRQKAEETLALGAQWAETPYALAARSEVVLSIVTDSAAVEQIALGPQGILSGLPAGGIHCDMSTVAPDGASRMAALYREKGRGFVQAPVLGSTKQIAAGTLLVVAGGEEADVAACEPVWRAFSERVWRLAGASEAASAKLACNLLIGHMIAGLGQSLLFGAKLGVPPETLLDILGASAMGNAMFASKGKTVIDRNFAANFFVRHMLKDLTLASDAARTVDLPLPINGLTRELFVAAMQQGYADEDYSAVIQVLEGLGGVTLRSGGSQQD